MEVEDMKPWQRIAFKSFIQYTESVHINPPISEQTKTLLHSIADDDEWDETRWVLIDLLYPGRIPAFLEATKPQTDYWCQDCHTWTTRVSLDDGIGAYEYAGARGFDSHKYMGCSECDGSDLLNLKGEEVNCNEFPERDYD